MMELKNRAHLLTEENQALFQQNAVLRSHYDQFNKEHEQKLEEANRKVAQFQKLQNDLQTVILQRDNMTKTNAFLDKKLNDTTFKLTVAEDKARSDHGEIQKLSE